MLISASDMPVEENTKRPYFRGFAGEPGVGR
jgi:hypothetical protein